MTGTRIRPALPLLALVLAIGAAIYCFSFFAPLMTEINQERGWSGGFQSDLYARWYGSRELFSHGRDPYSPEMTAEMQRGFFGHDTLPDGSELPQYAIFAHPIYLAFMIAPLTLLDFPTARLLATWLFPLLIASGALMWHAVLWRRAALQWRVAVFALALTAPPTIMSGWLQQPVALEFFFLAAAVYLVWLRRFAWAGALLAFSTIRPQESWALIGLLLCWSLFGWRERRSLLLSFAATMAALVVTSELALPGWISKFIASLQAYDQQFSTWRALSDIAPYPVFAVFGAFWLAAICWVGWRVRRDRHDSTRLAMACVVALLAALVILPSYHEYDGILLLPVLLAAPLAGQQSPLALQRLLIFGLALPLLLSQWLAATILGGLGLLGVAADSLPLLLLAGPWVASMIGQHLAFVALLPSFRQGAATGPEERVIDPELRQSYSRAQLATRDG